MGIIIISILSYLLLYSGITHNIVLYVIIIICNSFLYLLLSWIILNTEVKSKYVLLLTLTGIIIRLILIPVSPIASDDINRYIWDGKVQANGINPYRYAPSASELEHLSTPTLPSKVNFPDMKTIYPPIAQYVFYMSYELFGETFDGIKLFIFISELLSIWLLYLLLKTLDKDPKYLLLYAVCPLPILMFMVDGHIDGIGFPFLLLSLYLFVKEKKLNSYILYGLSISSKIITIILLPYFSKAEKGKMFYLTLVVPVIIFLLTYIPFLSQGVFPFESLITFTSHWMFNGSIFNIFYNLTGDNQIARQISYALFAVPAAVLFFIKMDLIKKVYYIFFLFFLFSPTVHPWYLTWVAVLLPLCVRWSGITFVSTVSISTYVIINYQLRGIWQESALLLFIEYLPVYSIFILELIRTAGKNTPRRVPTEIPHL